jgi:NADH-quinone oxidoreductase subunit E
VPTPATTATSDARAGLTDGDRRRAKAIIGRYPHAKSALLPLLHIAQDRNGWVTPAALEEIAEMLDLTPALVLGTCSFYTMFKREPAGALVVSVCTNVSCLVNGGPELLEALRYRFADDDDVLVEEVECLAACDVAPVLQVNYEYHNGLTAAVAIDLVEQYRRGELHARTISGTSTNGARRDTPGASPKSSANPKSSASPKSSANPKGSANPKKGTVAKKQTSTTQKKRASSKSSTKKRS